jgi:hypothetical protein
MKTMPLGFTQKAGDVRPYTAGKKKKYRAYCRGGVWLKGQKRNRKEIAIHQNEGIEKEHRWTQQTK